ncbi:MAG TPA: hypothetical protein VJH33_01745 [Candidatus Paceibacterota bacterium]
MPTQSILARLLAKAGLPPENECIGKIFAFTWTNQDAIRHRVIGRIDGLDCADIYSVNSGKFTIVTTSLKPRRSNTTNIPTISFRDEHDSFNNTREPATWHIYFNDLGPLEHSGPENPQIYSGTFELL